MTEYWLLVAFTLITIFNGLAIYNNLQTIKRLKRSPGEP